MAKSVLHKGHLENFVFEDFDDEVEILLKIYQFIAHFRSHSKTLHSLIIEFPSKKTVKFETFESFFWIFLERLSEMDKKFSSPDPRVDDDVQSNHYAYSLGQEAFFIILLHPQSPRWARRYNHPAIVFNPHIQFENLRKSGKFQKIRDLIRSRDKKLQGSNNPMLSDFGEKNEQYQYTGRNYDSDHSHPPWIPNSKRGDQLADYST